VSACASVAAECTPTDDSATQDVINTCAAEAANGESACTTAAGGVCRYTDLENMCTGQTDCVYDDASSDDVCEATDNADMIPRCTLIEAEDDSSSAVAAARDACLGGLTDESAECSYRPRVEYVPPPTCEQIFESAVTPTEGNCPAGCTFAFDGRDDTIAAGCSYGVKPTKPPDNLIPPGCINAGGNAGSCKIGAPYLTELESNKWSVAVTLVVVPAALYLPGTTLDVLAGGALSRTPVHMPGQSILALVKLVDIYANALVDANEAQVQHHSLPPYC
jgi:hypothetical protein